MTNIALRAAEESDLPFLRTLRAQTMREHYEHSGVPFDAQMQEARLHYRFDCAQIVVLDGVDVGLIKVSRDGLPWHLIQIQLSPVCQGRGFGQVLIRQLLADAQAAQAEVELSVLKANPAQHLYARLGFRVVGEEAHALTMRSSPPTQSS